MVAVDYRELLRKKVINGWNSEAIFPLVEFNEILPLGRFFERKDIDKLVKAAEAPLDERKIQIKKAIEEFECFYKIKRHKGNSDFGFWGEFENEACALIVLFKIISGEEMKIANFKKALKHLLDNLNHAQKVMPSDLDFDDFHRSCVCDALLLEFLFYEQQRKLTELIPRLKKLINSL